MNTRNLLLLLFVAAHLTGPAAQASIQCANLIYAGDNTSRCFSDQFLTIVQRETSVPTERRFRSVKLDSKELFRYPFVMMTGEKDFQFSATEAGHLHRYLCNGGFMLASAGCSSKTWDKSFRRNLAAVFDGQAELKTIPKDHPIYRTVFNITQLELSRGTGDVSLEGLEYNGKIVLVYSPHGLNNTANTKGCCCCGGNEIKNADQVNVNILAYALMH
ncbi:MAG: DUF4159 domain-containing protein [Puniceicoccaceae bacterium]